MNSVHLGVPHETHLSHVFWPSELVDELVQGVDWQLPAQGPHLVQKVLLQLFHPLQDTRAMGVPLLQGTCGEAVMKIVKLSPPPNLDGMNWERK